MTTKYYMYITIYGEINSKALYEEIKHFKVNVTDLINKTLVYATIDLTDPLVEYIMRACYKYSHDGKLNVDIKRVDETP